MRPFALHLTLASLALVFSSPARADVPSHDVYLTNAVEVRGLDKHPDWIVVVFPGAPPSGRPVAWPSLVEDGFQTVIDRKVLGKPQLWALPRTELDALKAAARDNDDELYGPVEKLLLDKGLACAEVPMQEKASLVVGAPDGRLISFEIEEIASGRCKMKNLGDQITAPDDWKRAPSWAMFAPRKKKPDAGAAPSASAPPIASTAPSAAVTPSASAPALPAPSAAPEARLPEPARGCGSCAVGDARGGGSWASLGALAALLVARRRRHI